MRFTYLLRVCVGVAILALIVSRFDLNRVLSVFKQADTYAILLGIFIFFLAVFVDIARLKAVVQDLFSWKDCGRMSFVGYFFENFLPTQAASDVYKIYVLREKVKIAKAITLIMIIKLVGLGLLVLAGLVYFAVFYRTVMAYFEVSDVGLALNRSLAWLNGWEAAVPAVALLVLAVVFRHRWRAWPWREFWQQVVTTWASLGGRGFALLTCAGVLYHGLRIVGLQCFLFSLGTTVGWLDLMFVVSVVAVVSMLPITIGALGVREGAIVALLSIYGVAAPLALSAAILLRLLTWLQGIVGGVLFIAARSSRPAGRSDTRPS